MSDEITEQISMEWGTVFVKSYNQKVHLNPHCRCKDDKYTQKSVDKYPPDHLDVCSRCEKMFQRWREGLRKDNRETECERCGGPNDHHTHDYCEDCQQVINQRRARKRPPSEKPFTD